MSPSERTNPRPVLALVAAGVVSLSILWWLPFSIEPPGRDQSLFTAQSQALLDGASLYTEIWEQKPPGSIFAYAAAQAIAGRGFSAVLLMEWLVGCVTALLLVTLVWRHTRSVPGSLGAALLYLAYHIGAEFDGYWGVAQPEVLMDPLLALLLLLLVPGTWRAGGFPWRGLVAGVCLAAMMGLKYSAVCLTLLAGARLLDRTVEPRKRLVGLAAFLAGLLVPALVWVVYLQLTGRLSLFWTATVTFNLAHTAISKLPRDDQFLAKFFYRFTRLLPLYLFAGIGVGLTLWDRYRTRRDGKGSERLLLWSALTWLAGLLAVFWQSKFWNYHYHVVLLPLSLMAGVGMARLHGLLRQTALRAAGSIAVIVLLGGVSMTVYVQRLGDYDREHRLRDFVRGDIERSEFLGTYRRGPTDYDVLDTIRAAERLAAETSPEERIFVWGFEPGIYVWAGRRPGSRFFYDYPLMPRFEKLHQGFLDQLMHDLETHRPVQFVAVDRDANDIEPRSSVDQVPQIPILRDYILENYEPTWRQGDFWVFRRKEP